MRRLLVVIAAAAFLPAALARPDAEVYAPKDGGYSAKFPGKPMERTLKIKSDGGDISIRLADYATSRGEVYGSSFHDLPRGKPAEQAVAPLLGQIVRGLAGDGKLTTSKDVEFGEQKLPGMAFTIEKGKQEFLSGLVVLWEDRVYQVFVQGSKSFVEGRDAKRFLESFALTK